jgi:hypothetical protein
MKQTRRSNWVNDIAAAGRAWSGAGRRGRHVYAVEKGRILVAPKHDPHSVSLTETGRQLLKKAGRPPPFETIGKGSREGLGRPVGLNTARRSS